MTWKNIRKYSFLKLWIIHTIVLYSLIGFLMSMAFAVFPVNPNSSFELFNVLKKTVAGPLAGILGWIDGVPAFVFFPILLMGLIRFFWEKSSWFTSYVLALLISYTIKGMLDRRWYLIGIAMGERQFKDLLPAANEDQLLVINILGTYLILLFPIYINWLLFRKQSRS